MTYAITRSGALLQLPLVGTFDVLMARGPLELLTDILVFALLLAGFGAVVLGALPHDLLGVSAAMLTVWLLGYGVGLIFDVTNGTVTVNVRAFTPEDALSLAQAILSSSERLVNELSERARRDTLQN